MDNNQKIFSDPLYGSIPIDNKICKIIIDTELFQRLKRIEQTSVCTIFHTARHNRFNHSLGTYFIGDYIFNKLQSNTKTQDPTLYEAIESLNNIKTPLVGPLNWNGLGATYRLACLLHDCGHSPFSHTFECYYLKPNEREEEKPQLYKDVIEAYEKSIDIYSSETKVTITKTQKNKIVKRFSDELFDCGAKPHELVSAWLVLHEKGFCRQICELGGCPMLAARMILGCRFSSNISDVYRFPYEIYNCFIGLLNGDEIDADRTDYAIRDRWATGLNTATVDIKLLFSSIHIAKDNLRSGTPVICFSKKAIPELERILEVKNYNQFWIFAHHAVVYHDRILKKAVEKLALLFCGDSAITKYVNARINNEDQIASGAENESMYAFFDYHNLINPTNYEISIDGDLYKEIIYLLSDDDILHLLKKYFCSGIIPKDSNLLEIYNRNNYAQEWFSRDYRFIPLWKSYVEFCNSFINHHYELVSLRALIKTLQDLHRNGEDKITIEKLLNNESFRVYYKELLEKRGDDNSVNKLLFCQEAEVRLDHNIINNCKNALMTYENGLKGDFQICIDNCIASLKNEGFCPIIPATKIIDEQVVQLKSIKTQGIFLDLSESTDNSNSNVIKCYTDLDIPIRNQSMKINFFYAFLPILKDEKGNELSKTESRRLYTDEIQKQIERIYHDPNDMMLE